MRSMQLSGILQISTPEVPNKHALRSFSAKRKKSHAPLTRLLRSSPRTLTRRRPRLHNPNPPNQPL